MLEKIEVKKDAEDRDAIWMCLHRDSEFIDFIVNGEFESGELKFLEEIEALKEKIKDIL